MLWGLVGGLAFLVLVQGYELLTDRAVAILPKAVVAIGVAVVVTLVAYRVRPRLYGNERT